MHCHWHNVDEPGPGYIGCGECGHLYRTAGQLRRAYRRVIWQMWRYDAQPGARLPWLWRTLWRAATVRARRISFCQECIHDF